MQSRDFCVLQLLTLKCRDMACHVRCVELATRFGYCFILDMAGHVPTFGAYVLQQKRIYSCRNAESGSSFAARLAG